MPSGARDFREVLSPTLRGCGMNVQGSADKTQGILGQQWSDLPKPTEPSERENCRIGCLLGFFPLTMFDNRWYQRWVKTRQVLFEPLVKPTLMGYLIISSWCCREIPEWLIHKVAPHPLMGMFSNLMIQTHTPFSKSVIHTPQSKFIPLGIPWRLIE